MGIHKGRHAAHLDGDFVVFLVGVRMTKCWKPLLWLYVFIVIWPMLWRLKRNPASGLLAYQPVYFGGFAFIQYWRSFEQLEAFARSKSEPHLARWTWFNKAVADSGDLGIWHETYIVRSGDYECVYGNMPLHGLARAGQLVPMATKGQSARRRLGLTDSDEVPVPFY